jgi:hypothetical protein
MGRTLWIFQNGMLRRIFVPKERKKIEWKNYEMRSIIICSTKYYYPWN